MEKGLIILTFSLLAICTGCSFGFELPPCPYNMRLEYWYAGSSSENVLPVYVNNLTQYFFDGEGKLVAAETLRGDSVKGYDADLPPGDYTVVVWGNTDNGGGSYVDAPTEGENRLSELTLSAVTAGVPPGYRDNTGRLYYGTSSFSVEEGKVHRERIYLSHAHAALSVTVVWKSDASPPPAGGVYRMRMRNIPAIYGFVKGWEAEIPSGDGMYSIPWIENTLTNHETRASMNYDEEVVGQFITYRYTSHTHQMWSLWRDGIRIIKELDLHKFFSTLPMSMDENFEQEFDILVTVYKDKITVSLASASDWNEGGVIG